MNDRERRGWITVGAIFATFFFIWGAINSSSVFFVPVIKYFGWTRARMSIALSIGWVTGGAAGPVIGWLSDRIDPKKMMVVGATVTGLAWLALSRSTGFGEYLAINGLFGISVSAATSIPASIIIAKWFQARRGLAIGIAFSGGTIGGAVIAVLANRAIEYGGWRFGYAMIGMPILLIVVPAIVFFVRGRAPEHAAAAAHDDPAYPVTSIEIPGLEIAQARRTRSFWLICAAQLLFGFSTGMGPHFIAYLIGSGYSAGFAASAISLFLIVTTAGTVLGGPIADRFSARAAITVTFLMTSIGMIGLLLAAHPIALALNILCGGFAAGAMGVQMPLVQIESLGIKRLGSILGITGIFFTAGAAISPVITGRIFDLTHSYSFAISSFVAMAIACALAIYGCRPLDREQQALGMTAADAA